MIVVDTSAFISLGFCDLVLVLLKEFEVHTTEVVIDELKEMREYEDEEGETAKKVIENKDEITIHEFDKKFNFKQRDIDRGEGSCAVLAKNTGTDFLITDDVRALPYLKTISMTKVVFSPIVLKALVHRNILSEKEAEEKLTDLIESRDWFETPIYEKSLELFE